MAMRSGTPALSMFRAALRRTSWRSISGTAFRHAVVNRAHPAAQPRQALSLPSRESRVKPIQEGLPCTQRRREMGLGEARDTSPSRKHASASCPRNATSSARAVVARRSKSRPPECERSPSPLQPALRGPRLAANHGERAAEPLALRQICSLVGSLDEGAHLVQQCAGFGGAAGQQQLPAWSSAGARAAGGQSRVSGPIRPRGAGAVRMRQRGEARRDMSSARSASRTRRERVARSV